MSFSKPQVTIDLDEYNHFLKVEEEKKQMEIDSGKIPEEILSEIINRILDNFRHDNYRGFVCEGWEVVIKSGDTSGNFQDYFIRNINTKKA